MFKISYSNDAMSSKIIEGQSPEGYWIQNPQITNEKIDYRLQISYAL